jgi:putative flippase GtrA
MTFEQGRRRSGRAIDADFSVAALHPLLAIMPQLKRYAVVSALALALDFTVFIAINGALGHPTVAGVAGYGCGIVLHYYLSRRFVFDTDGSPKSSRRMFSEFLASGLVGLAATAAVIAVATGVLGVPALAAKVVAAGASFLGVYLIRRTIVFA